MNYFHIMRCRREGKFRAATHTQKILLIQWPWKMYVEWRENGWILELDLLDMIRVMMMSLYKFYVYIHTENETQRILALKAFFFLCKDNAMPCTIYKINIPYLDTTTTTSMWIYVWHRFKAQHNSLSFRYEAIMVYMVMEYKQCFNEISNEKEEEKKSKGLRKILFFPFFPYYR